MQKKNKKENAQIEITKHPTWQPYGPQNLKNCSKGWWKTYAN